MGDGLVERMNRSLLSLMRSYVNKERDWEEHLQLLLFLYRTTKHATTGLSPYEVLFGSNPPSLHTPDLPSTSILEPSDYSAVLRGKILELRELVNANQVESADQQQKSYLGCKPNISVGQKVLLSNPTKGKLGHRWTGPWKVTALKGPTTIVLKMGCTERVVHANRVRPLLIDEDAGADHGVLTDWSPPLFHYNVLPYSITMKMSPHHPWWRMSRPNRTKRVQSEQAHLMWKRLLPAPHPYR